MAASSSASSFSSSVGSWRTAFLTLRDETLNSPPCTTLIHLLNHLIFSHSNTLIAVAPDMPSPEVTSDLMFLMELARNAADSAGVDDMTHTFAQLSHLIYNVSRHVSLDINSSCWALMLESFGRMLDTIFAKASRKRVLEGNVVPKAIGQCLETMRCLISVYKRKCLLSEYAELLNFLISIVAYSHGELFCSSSSSVGQRYVAEFGKRIPGYNSLWEVQTATLTMIGDVFSRVGSSLSVDIWKSTVQVLKEVTDVLASKHFLVEDNIMARFYTSLFHCLHLVIMDPKGPLSDYVAGFVAALRLFFTYGIASRSQFLNPLLAGNKKEISSPSLKMSSEESGKSGPSPYRPPHRRKHDLTNLQHLKSQESLSLSDPDYSNLDHTSSDSDYSDSDGSAKDADNIRCTKARVAAIVCIQDLCRGDPKIFTAQWTMLLPSSDVLQPRNRKYEATLMTCLLFDPYLKARMASASTLVAMLDGPASVFLQVAEYKESTKCGSFTALSSSLGQILMQLHTGVLYLIQHETHSVLLASSFKILMLLISSTPYSRDLVYLLPIVPRAFQVWEDNKQSCLTVQLINVVLSTLAKSVSKCSAMSRGLKMEVSGEQSSSQIQGKLKEDIEDMRIKANQVGHPGVSANAGVNHRKSLIVVLIAMGRYSRMPENLLPTLISSIRARVEEGFPQRSDQASLLAVAINCLTAALSVSPSSPKVKDLFLAELCRGSVEAEEFSGVLSTIFRFSEAVNSPTISLEALQALRAVSHNYPDIIILCWVQISSTTYGFLRFTSLEDPTRPWKGNIGNVTGSTGEKVITAAIKVLDECLRAISGFKGTEDLSDDKLLDTPFTSDHSRIKKISSAPSYGSESLAVTKDEPEANMSGIEQWSEAIEKHVPLVLLHSSAMVRAASVTCFAGLTSSVFSALPKEKQDFVLNSSINAALKDEVPSVRSAACRAIGVITCFPQIFQRVEILGKFIDAAEINSRYSLVLVRITASWALANMCDSLRHCIDAVTSKRSSVDSKVTSQLIARSIECALRLTTDGDKIKANAVRALGNLSRFVQFSKQSGVDDEPVDGVSLSQIISGAEKLPARSDLGIRQKQQSVLSSFQGAFLDDSLWLGRMVQAFLSCVATGNVKVQWNVCHALSHLFLNETVKLADMDWAPSVFSILLVLLRDSPNYKIRIQAAAALAVPVTTLDYGGSFSDVIQGVELALENLSSDQITPSSFRYRTALEKQAPSNENT
ncbi:hypothetical protein RHSIM_Rhsim02G0255700 [Rhododendron simsii]|uniref:DUF4042 domain-containing protein n=1 Tax=Rhododendron simsii TaxID=118357 RepID=A0A834HGN7_RHOSS|nr:hypothetical protein RHSIM_Rhsim02G0255700 [Rhododendron simsii]